MSGPGPVLDAAALDAIEARCEAATPGPWERRARNRTNGVPIVAGEYIEARVYGDPANAAFIAAARTDVPALVAALRRERAAGAALMGLIEGIRRRYPERGSAPWWYEPGHDGGHCDLCLAGAWGAPESIIHDPECPVPAAEAARAALGET